MSKKALENIWVDGVNYEKGKVYSDEQVAHIDATLFETVGETPTEEITTEETVVEETTTSDEVAPEIDTETPTEEITTEETVVEETSTEEIA